MAKSWLQRVLGVDTTSVSRSEKSLIRDLKLAQRNIQINTQAQNRAKKSIRSLTSKSNKEVMKGGLASIDTLNRLRQAHSSYQLATKRLDHYNQRLVEANSEMSSQGAQSGKVWVKAYNRADGTPVKGFFRGNK